MTVYLVADIHGHIRLNWLQSQIDEKPLNGGDHLIILGDAGIIWHLTDHPEVKGYYESLPCPVLFLDGNHENYDLLDRYPIIEKNGGKMQCVGSNIFHLMRGETYLINKKRIFVFGGGFSLKKLDGSSPVSVWDREMPNELEYLNGLEKLGGCDYSVDYILTHVAPFDIASALGREPGIEERRLNDYLSYIALSVDFNHWYFGHYHVDSDVGRYSAVYERIIVME